MQYRIRFKFKLFRGLYIYTDDTCIYQLKNHLKMCLVAAADRKTDVGSNLGSYYLAQLPCNSITEEHEQWTRKDFLICSSKNRNCISKPYDDDEQDEPVNLILMQHKEWSYEFLQDWKIMNTTEKDGSIQIALAEIERQMCWYDHTTKDSGNDKIPSASKAKKALISVESCKKSSQQHFFFEPVNNETNKGKNYTFNYAAKYNERKSKKNKKNKHKNDDELFNEN